MDPKFQTWVQREGWDLASNDYEGAWRRQLQPATDKLMEFANPRAGETVIEAASGTGVVTLAVAEKVETGRVLATDLSPNMLATLEIAAQKAGISNIETATCSAERLATEDQFDLALCALGLMYVPNPLQAIAELDRTLRPGGRAAISVWGERRNCGWASLFGIIDARVKSDVCPMFFAMGAPSALTDALSRQGFVNVKDERIRVTLDFPDDEAALNAAFLGGPVALAYARFNEGKRASARADYLEAITPHRHGDGYRLPGEFVIASGNKPGPHNRQPTNEQPEGTLP